MMLAAFTHSMRAHTLIACTRSEKKHARNKDRNNNHATRDVYTSCASAAPVAERCVRFTVAVPNAVRELSSFLNTGVSSLSPLVTTMPPGPDPPVMPGDAPDNAVAPREKDMRPGMMGVKMKGEPTLSEGCGADGGMGGV